MKLYLLSNTLCLLAYLGVAQTAFRDRLWWPLAYSSFCAFACAGVWVAVASPQFRADFVRYFVPFLIAAWGFFAMEQFKRYQTLSTEELLLTAALLCGAAMSYIAGEALGSGIARLTIQAAAVVIPIAIALAQIGAWPLPEPVSAPAFYLQTPAGDPAPPLGVTI